MAREHAAQQEEQSQEQHENMLEKGWHKLEDLTGGRAQAPKAGDQQESNFEHITSHEDAGRH